MRFNYFSYFVEENGEGEENKPKKQTYVPPDPTEDENEMFNSGLACGKNFDKYDSIEVKVSGQGDIPKPIQSFEQSGLRPHIISLIKKSHYTKPTPIQKHAIPLLLSGRDLMACAQTGSGKTVRIFRAIKTFNFRKDFTNMLYNFFRPRF